MYPFLEDGVWYHKVDTLVIVNGSFDLTGNITETTPAIMRLDDMHEVELYIEPVKMTLQIDRDRPSEYRLSGTKSERELTPLRNIYMSEEVQMHTQNQLLNNLLMELNSSESNNKDSIAVIVSNEHRKLINILHKIDSIRLKYALDHIDYAITPNLISLSSKMGVYENEILKDKLPEKSKQSLMGQLTATQLALPTDNARSDIGDIAPDFIRNSSTGHLIRLSDYRDKSYVLLDFWASWCGW